MSVLSGFRLCSHVVTTEGNGSSGKSLDCFVLQAGLKALCRIKDRDYSSPNINESCTTCSLGYGYEEGRRGEDKKGNIGLAKDIVLYCVLLEQVMRL